jgi:hypothetical protein
MAVEGSLPAGMGISAVGAIGAVGAVVPVEAGKQKSLPLENASESLIQPLVARVETGFAFMALSALQSAGGKFAQEQKQWLRLGQLYRAR